MNLCPHFSNRVDLTNDIAAIRLTTPLTLNGDTVNAICLPDASLRATGTAVVTGWGATREGGAVSNQLMEVSVPIVDDQTCDDLYAEVGGSGMIFDSMICAGDVEDGGVDSCQGDSGGPFIVPGNNSSWVLAGVVSWGYGCAEPGFPGVYTEVAYFVDWIEKTTGVSLSKQRSKKN